MIYLNALSDKSNALINYNLVSKASILKILRSTEPGCK